MKSKTTIKLMLDIVMTVLFLILIDPKNTGFTFHEIAGLAIGGMFVFHIILNWSWVRGVTKNLLNPKLKTRSKWYYALNVVSFISVMTIMITGVEISRVLFASGSGGNSHSLVALHKWVSYFCLGLFGVHIALHWRFILDAIHKLVNGLKLPSLGKAVMGAGVSVLVASMLYTQIAAGFKADEDRVITRRETPTSQPSQVYNSTSSQSTNSSASVGAGSATSQSQVAPSKSSNFSTNTANAGTAVTLTDYLGKLFCNGCERHCSLLNLGCDKGIRQLEAAKAQYTQLYGTTATLN